MASATSAFGQQEKQFSAKLMGNNEVPPVNTPATGVANFTLSPDEKSLHYTLSTHDIAGVMGAHIHVGTSTQNGPILFTLLNSSTSATPSLSTGISTTGTITSSDIRGNLTGKPILPHAGMAVGSMRELTNLLTSGTAYVNVHTQQHQNGEIRGQIGPTTSNMTTSPSSNMTTSPSSNMTTSPPFNNSTFPTTRSTPLSLGKPFINYTESDKSPTPQQKFINGTHILVMTYAGNSTIRNIPPI
ncbi:MAG: CHRD domain-containing protein [Candidatus Nitrosopolaris sp.]